MTAAADLREAAGQLARFPEQVVRHAVDELAKAVERQLRTDTGGDNRLSGVRGKRKLQVERKVTAFGTGFAEGSVAAGPRRMLGPWRWLNDGTGEPGPTRAKGTFDGAVQRSLPAVELQIANQFDTLIR